MTDFYPDSYYSRTLNENAARPALESAVESDVCIIGGGLAGLCVALSLLERGKKAVILEQKRVGWGASGLNGGFVLGGFTKAPARLIEKVGPAHARALYALTTKARGLIKSRIAEHGISCDLREGHMEVSWHDNPGTLKEEEIFMREKLGESPEFWPREKVRDSYHSSRYYDALFYPDFFHLHPLNYLRGLATAIEKKGGKIFEGSAATALKETPGGITVSTARGSVKAAQVILCGSALLKNVERKLARSLVPVNSYIAVTEPLPAGTLKKAIEKPYSVADDRWAGDYYRPLPDNSLQWGGRIGLSRQPPTDLGRLMLADILDIYPQLEGVKIRMTWSGIMAHTLHRMPHIRPLRPGVWACSNFGSYGLAQTAAAGEVVASAIAEGGETYKLFEPFGLFWTGGILGTYAAQALYFSYMIKNKLTGIAAKRKK